ncbi:MAG: amino acid permease, partial [Nocardioidaceae bacterium]
MVRITDARHRLPRVLGTTQLVMLGLGVMIGAGIFSLSGAQAAVNAGPAVILSFGIAAVICFVAALSYAELSSTIPVAGSSYTFTYV